VLHHFFSLGCEGATICFERAIKIHVLGHCLQWDEQASSNVASQEASQHEGRRTFPGKCLIDQRGDNSALLAAAPHTQQKTPNFRRLSEFSENLTPSASHHSRRVFITPLIHRMFFLQRRMHRFWPASCGVAAEQDVR
jgi:hypothetical protein